MQTNNLFTFQRFMMLCKQSLIINKKMIGIGLVGFTGALFISLIFIQSKTNLANWEIKNYMMAFYFFFLVPGIIYSSLSFPAFRSKEKSMAYLLLPASASEKFVFELVSHIVLFIVVMPLLFWVVVNLEGALMHNFYPDFTHYKFSFSEAYHRNSYSSVNEWWTNFVTIQGVLFALTFSFAGASHFSKSPLLKTIFTFTILFAGFAFITYLLSKGLNLSEYHYMSNKFLFNNQNDIMIYGGIFAMLVNLSLLAIAFFRLKEREI